MFLVASVFLVTSLKFSDCSKNKDYHHFFLIFSEKLFLCLINGNKIILTIIIRSGVLVYITVYIV